MPENTEQVETVDHRFEANRWVDAAEREASNEDRDPQIASAFAAAAQVHASLAIAEQLERLNEQLAASNLTYADGMVRDA